MYKLLSLLFSITIFLQHSVTAQLDFRDGFIVTNENDTLKGFVEYRSNAQNYLSCNFKNSQGITTKYTVDQLISFGYDQDKVFRSTIFEGSFVEALVEGDLSLYKFNDYYLFKKNNEIHKIDLPKKTLVVVDGQTLERMDSKWRGQITYLISDCGEKNSTVSNNIKYDEKSLTNLTIRYNECKGSNFFHYKEKRSPTKISFGGLLGVSMSNIDNPIYSNSVRYLNEKYSTIDPTFGLIVLITPEFSDKMTFQSDLLFTHAYFSGTKETSSLATREINHTSIELSTLTLPLSFNYNFSHSNNSFFISGGLVFDYHLKTKSTFVLESYVSNNNDEDYYLFPETTAFPMNNFQFGLQGGAGYFKTFKKFIGVINLRYYQYKKLNKVEGPLSMTNNRITLSISVIKK